MPYFFLFETFHKLYFNMFTKLAQFVSFSHFEFENWANSTN